MTGNPTPMHDLIRKHGDAIRASGIFQPSDLILPDSPAIITPEPASPDPRFDRRVLPALALIVSGDRHAQEDRKVANAWARGLERRFQGIAENYRYTVLIHGAAPGIDTIAHMIGTEYAFAPIPMPYIEGAGRSGGPRRNKAMIRTALAIAETGYDTLAILCHHDLLSGESRGTRNMYLLLEKEPRFPVEVYASPDEMAEGGPA